jgi:hypothetical protein
VHDKCGEDVEIAYRCPACRKTVAADHVRRQRAGGRRAAPRPSRRGTAARP